MQEYLPNMSLELSSISCTKKGEEEEREEERGKGERRRGEEREWRRGE